MYDGVTVIEIVLGREALWGVRNRNLLPLGAAIQLRNITLEDHSFRTGGGAAQVGTAIGQAGAFALDYFPSGTAQRTVAACTDGSVRKDDGDGDAWVTLVSGLTTSGAVPYLVEAGAESAGRNRKVFHCDRINAVRVLSGDAATMTVIASPPADWTGANQPGFLAPHQGFLWGGGNANAPHMLYRSLQTDHEDFLSTTFTIPIDPGTGERLVAGLSYKGGLLVWKYPKGVWFVETSDATPGNWRAYQVGIPGCAGAANIALIEDDVLWIAPDGSFHLISATQATGSVRASDLAYRKLGSWVRDQIALSRLVHAQFAYHSHKGEMMLGCSALGATAKNRRLHLDVNRREDIGERWVWWDRDRNEALFMRKKSEIHIPAMLDENGQLWELDNVNRNADGAAYTSEWFLGDNDFGALVPEFKGRKKNLRFVQLEHDPRGTASVQLEVYRDGSLKQTINTTLEAGASALPQTLPFTLGVDALKTTARRRLRGQATRLAFRGQTTVVNEDASLTRILVGVEAGE